MFPSFLSFILLFFFLAHRVIFWFSCVSPQKFLLWVENNFLGILDAFSIESEERRLRRGQLSSRAVRPHI